MLAFLKTVFEILFGGYATPTKMRSILEVGSEQLLENGIKTQVLQ